jgi:cytochrome P450
MSVRMVHDNESIFPDPEKFIPERWLGPEAKDADKWLVVFSKGPRQCIGMK